MNDNDRKKSWGYWLFLCVKQLAVLAPYFYTGFLVWCGCKYDVPIGAWILVFLISVFSF